MNCLIGKLEEKSMGEYLDVENSSAGWMDVGECAEYFTIGTVDHEDVAFSETR